MKIMDFSICEFLKIIPNVSKIPNLEDLTLNGCINLVEIHDSVGSHDKLVSLSLRDCHNLSSFPTSLKLRSLQFLSLDGCSRISQFPEIECQMEFLKCINFGGTGIQKLPSSIRDLIGLEQLCLDDCINLMNLPSCIYELQYLEILSLNGCSKLVKFPEKMGNSGQSMLPPMNSSVSNDGSPSIVFPALKWLDLENCVLLESDLFRIFNSSSTLKVLRLSRSGIVTIPACIERFVALFQLDLDNCKQLREIQAFPPNIFKVHAWGCMSLDLNNTSLPELPKKLLGMTRMDFSRCEFLKTIPDVSKIPNLMELILNGCTNLVEIPDYVGSLDRLATLSLKNCYNLSSFPTSLKLQCLQFLSLDGCSRINHFPEIECQMKFLKRICFGGTGIKELPSSIRYLIGLEELNLKDCINLKNLPSSIYQLQHLKELVLGGCSKLVKFREKMGDSGQSMLPPPNSIVSNDGCFSIVFPALRKLYLENCVLLESDFFRIFNCSSTLEELDLSGSSIVTTPACIKRFVALKYLRLNNCKQLREIQAFAPSSCCVDAKGCMSLDLYNTCWLPKLPAPKEHSERHSFNIYVSGNKIPDWFSYRKEVSNSNSCEIDIDVPADLDGEITTIAFSAVFEIGKYDELLISVFVSSGGVEIYHHDQEELCSDCVWLHFHVPESFKRKENNGHLRVKFVCKNVFGDRSLTHMKSCGFHLVRRCEEKMIDSIDGIQVTKGPRDDDGNLESNWYPQQKRHSSTLGVRILDAEAKAKEF